MVEQVEVKRIPIQRECFSCEHFNDYGTWCRHWKDKVPEEFKRKGCDAWKEDEIPF